MDAIIVDMDGTLCDVSGVSHYVTGDKRNFDAFHRASLFCPPRDFVAFAVDVYRRHGYAVIVVTARDARYERVTRDWLAKYGVEFDALYMRPWGDQRRDTAVKNDIHAAIVEAGYNPVIAIDDRQDIADVWESHGIYTLLVPSEDAPG